MVFSEYTKRRILFHQAKGCRASTIVDKLRDEGIIVSRKGVSDFLSRVEIPVVLLDFLAVEDLQS